jgi:hypothetical protein
MAHGQHYAEGIAVGVRVPYAEGIAVGVLMATNDLEATTWHRTPRVKPSV